MDPGVEQWRRAVWAAFTTDLPRIDEGSILPLRVNVGPVHVRGHPRWVEEQRGQVLYVPRLRDHNGNLHLQNDHGRVVNLNHLNLGAQLFLKPRRVS